MKEITRIHLAKIPYEIEISAKKQLEKYLNDLKIYSGDQDIFEDVEIRITEILAELGVKENGVITENEILKIEAQIGSPEVFQDLDFEDKKEEIRIPKISKKLYRDEKNGMISGVTAGIAQYLNVDVVWVRLALIVAFFVTFSSILPIYILASFVVPAAKNANDILRLRGEAITASAIREVNDEYDFEKIAMRKTKLARIFGVIFGIFAIFAFLGGILLMFFGNWALVNMIELAEFANAKNAMIGLIVSANMMGIAYLIFTAFIAKMLFKLKSSKVDIAALITSVVIAFAGFLGTFSFAAILRDKSNEKISKSLVSEQVKIDSEKMKSVKKLKVNSSAAVFYHISSEQKIEFTHMDFEKHNLKTEFEGETLKLNLSRLPHKNPYFGGIDREEIHIYGPELNEIELDSDTVLKYFAKNSENMKVKMNRGVVEFENSAKIENLEVSKGDVGAFSAENIDVANFKLNSDGGNVELNNIENADITTKKCNFSQRATHLKARVKNVKVNGYEFNENTKGQCLYVEDHEDDRF